MGGRESGVLGGGFQGEPAVTAQIAQSWRDTGQLVGHPSGWRIHSSIEPGTFLGGKFLTSEANPC